MRTNGRLPEPVEVAAYYVVSEALTNAAKHGHASRVTVGWRPPTTCCESASATMVSEAPEFGRGSGLVGLKDRVEALGGRITLVSEPAAGTSLSIELPLTDNAGCAARDHHDPRKTVEAHSSC